MMYMVYVIYNVVIYDVYGVCNVYNVVIYDVYSVCNVYNVVIYDRALSSWLCHPSKVGRISIFLVKMHIKGGTGKREEKKMYAHFDSGLATFTW